MQSKHDHVSVCICTYKRPQLLRKLLNSLQHQITNQLFTYSIVVVDNDSEQSGRQVAETFQKPGLIPLKYFVEHAKNISLTRNKAIGEATGEFFALIDDDEYPSEAWLLRLYQTIKAFNVEGVLGPVIPEFELPPPKWVISGNLCDRERYKTGASIKKPRDTRTSNVLLSEALINNDCPVFDPKFGLTGGEDTDFFKRAMNKGARFVWCDEALVYETVPETRMTRKYFLKRALLRGEINAQNTTLFSLSMGKSIIAVICYLFILPILFIINHGVFMRYLVKTCDHLGKLLAVIGINLVTKRTF